MLNFETSKKKKRVRIIKQMFFCLFVCLKIVDVFRCRYYFIKCSVCIALVQYSNSLKSQLEI